MSERDVTPSGGTPFSLKPRIVVIGLIVIAVIILVTSSFFVVDQTEQAVVLMLGRFNRLAGPGLHFKMPFNIERNYNVPTQVVQTMQFGFRTERPGVTTVYARGRFPEESLMLTGDLNIVDVEWTTQYRIVDPVAWLFNVENRERTIRDISQSVINMLVGDRAILDVIGSERANIEMLGQNLMNERFQRYGLGINVITVRLRNILPPAGAVQDAFEDVNKAVQDMNRFINEGKEAYNTEIPRVRGEAEQMILAARGYAAERVNTSRGLVDRFEAVREEYQGTQEVTRRRLYIEMIEDVFSREEGTDLIDRNLENFIPLKQLQAQGGAQ